MRAQEPLLLMAAGPIWVRCPRCGSAAQVNQIGSMWQPRGATLSCTRCGFARRDPAAFLAGRADFAWMSWWNPRCARCGRPTPQTVGQVASRHKRRLTVRSHCQGCGHVSIMPARPARWAGHDARDPCFDLPLFLTEPVGGKLLWAHNRAHVELLASWLGAALRERSRPAYHRTMMSRLPRWMKLASARPRLLRALDLLRQRADREGLS